MRWSRKPKTAKIVPPIMLRIHKPDGTAMTVPLGRTDMLTLDVESALHGDRSEAMFRTTLSIERVD